MTSATAQFRPIDPPALPQSGMPFLTTAPNGTAYLAWTDTIAEKEHALRFSRFTGAAWTPPETIAQGRNWFINWGDFPSLSVLADGSMLAHWLTRAPGGGTYGYGIRIARRDPVKPVWTQIHGVSLDEKVDYAGFLTFIPGAAAALYLAPPPGNHTSSHGDDHDHRKTVRFVSFLPDGKLDTDREVDPSACSCCQTAIGKTRSGLIAAYRDRLPGEIRDISVIRHVDGAWTAPRTLHPDGWHINGCPTDGPGLVARDNRVAIVWLTRAGGPAKVQLALSSDEGRTFQSPLRIDGGNPLGRPAITALDDDNYLALWMEKTDSGVDIRLRRLPHNGKPGPPITVAHTPGGRAPGFPKLAVSGAQILLAWREERVRAVAITKAQFKEKESR